MNSYILAFLALIAFSSLVRGQGNDLTILQNGNIGVDIAQPQERLHVNGNVIIPNNSYYLSLRSDNTTPHQVFGMDPNNDIVFNRNAIVSSKSSGLILAATNNRFIQFRNENNEKLLHIEPGSGNIGIGTTTPTDALTLAFGNASKPNGGTWVATSDSRAKRNIRPYDDGLSLLLKVNPVIFNYNGKFGTVNSTKDYIGVVAQEMDEILPYTVSMAKFTEGNITSNFLQFDGTALTYLLINSVKELEKELRRKNMQIENLQELYSDLKNQIKVIREQQETN